MRVDPLARIRKNEECDDGVLYEAAYVIGLLAAADAFESGATLGDFRRFVKTIAGTRGWPPAVLREVCE